MNWFTIFLRGFLMGACDIVPGISGGTIAFITGIYDRLLSAVGSLSELDIKLLKKGKFKKFFKPLDLPFLIPLGLGILVAIVSVSKLVLYLLQNYTSPTLAFFVGLILASGIYMFTHVKKRTKQVYVFVVLGLLAGILISLLPTQVGMSDPSYFVVALGGFIAITAMILPGVSGSFLLLVMGLYVTTLEALHNFDILYLVFFAVGAMLSLLFVTRGIKHILKTYHERAMSFLTGLVLGALLVPLKEVDVSGLSAIFIVAGIIVSVVLSRLKK